MPRGEGRRLLANVPVTMPTITATNMATSSGSFSEIRRILDIIPASELRCQASRVRISIRRKQASLTIVHTVRLKPDVIKQRPTPPATIWNGVQMVCHVS